MLQKATDLRAGLDLAVRHRAHRGCGRLPAPFVAEGRWFWPICAMVTLVLWTVSTNARASGAVAVSIGGPGSKEIRTEVVASLPVDTTVIDQVTLLNALSQRQIDDVGKAVLAPNHSHALVGAVRQAASAIGADAVVLGTVRPGKGKHPTELILLVVLASQEDPALDVAVPLKGDRRELWKKTLGPALDAIRAAPSKGGAPAAVEKTKKAEPNEAEANGTAGAASTDGESAKPGTESPSVERPSETGGAFAGPASVSEAMLVGALSFDFGGRQFHYNQRVTEATLRPYDLPQGFLFPVTPGIAGSVEVYPLVRSKLEIARDIGVSAHVGADLAKVQLGAQVTNVQWSSWELDLRARVPLGPRATAPFLGFEAGGGELAFSFKDAGLNADVLPSVDYKYLRLAADGRVPFGRAAVIGGAAYRAVLGTGQLGDHFPKASVAGMDAHVGASYQLTSFMEARIVVHYVRFWATLNPAVNAKYVAGGETDQFANADLGIAAFF
jgi:hypothetical protein